MSMRIWLSISFLPIFMIFDPTYLAGQADPFEQARRSIYQGYVLDKEESWKAGLKGYEAVEELDKALYPSLWYDYLLAQYGWIGYCLAKEREGEAKTRLDQVIEASKELLESHPDHAPTEALLGGLYGLKIGLSPARAIYLGPRSLSYIESALKAAPARPEGWVEKGNARFHSPSVVGGSKEEAVSCFLKAKANFDRQPALKKDNWLYLHTLAWLGQAYEATDKPLEARQIYAGALKEAPQFKWVKETLLPGVSR